MIFGQDWQSLLEEFTDKELRFAIEQGQKELDRRLIKRVVETPNIKIRTIRAGFSGSAGVIAYGLGLKDNMVAFSNEPNGESRWLVHPDEIPTTLVVEES